MEDERLFLAVVRAGGFSAAARVTGTSQSRVSRAVIRLEKRLGATLLRRSSRHVEVTVAGEAYARGLSRISRELDALESNLRDPTGMTGSLRVTSAPALTRRLLASGLAEFTREHPDVQLVMELVAQRRNLLEDGFDLAIRFGPLVESWRKVTRILRGQYHVYAPPEFAEVEVSEQGLEAVPCLVLHSTHLRNRWPVLRGRRVEWLGITPTHLFDDVDLLISCASRGMGVTVLPDFLVRSEVARGELVRVTAAGPPAEVFAVMEAKPSPLARALVPFLRKSAKASS